MPVMSVIRTRALALKSCQWMICGDAGGRLAILEGELPGEIRKRARVRTGCPGIAASSTVRSLSDLGRWLAAGIAEM